VARWAFIVALGVLTAAGLDSCAGGATSAAPQARTQGLPRGGAAIAVAGDTLEQFAANLAAAKAQGKNVRFVKVATAAGVDPYSVYAQVVRTPYAIVVRAYRQMMAYPLAGTTVTYSGAAEPIEISSLPQVSMPKVDTAVKNGAPGSSKDVLSRLCGHCVLVLVHGAAEPINAKLWESKEDPWQVKADYVFWAPGTETISSGQRKSQYIKQTCAYTSDCNGCGASIQYCFPSQGSYQWPFYHPPEPTGGGGGAPPPIRNCDRNVLSVRRTPRSIDRSRLQDLAAAIARNAVPDEKVDENIDPQIQGAQRAYIKAAMLRLAPAQRQHVAGIDEQGNFFSNRESDYIQRESAQPWRQISGNLWISPSGHRVAFPNDDLSLAASGRRTSSTGSPPCPPPGSSTTGGYVRGYFCNSTSRSFTAAVDATNVGGAPGPSWCMTSGPTISGDTGFLLVGGWSGSGAAEVGLLWNQSIYEMYDLDPSGNPTSDFIPASWSFQPGLFSLTFTTYAGSYYWSFTATSASGPSFTWMHNKASLSAIGTVFTYKQATTIGQNVAGFTNDGSYFGVDEYDDPLFAWSGASGSDGFPDATRAIRIGNNYGINLHP
jgi:hypothetical protein